VEECRTAFLGADAPTHRRRVTEVGGECVGDDLIVGGCEKYAENVRGRRVEERVGEPTDGIRRTERDRGTHGREAHRVTELDTRRSLTLGLSGIHAWFRMFYRRGVGSRVGVDASGREYADGVTETANSIPEFDVAAMAAEMRPPSVDDVPIALDGTLLDTPTKLIAYLDRINAAREALLPTVRGSRW
jgi:hypothetical protein